MITPTTIVYVVLALVVLLTICPLWAPALERWWEDVTWRGWGWEPGPGQGAQLMAEFRREYPEIKDVIGNDDYL